MNSRRGIFPDHHASLWAVLTVLLVCQASPVDAFQARVIQFSKQSEANENRVPLTILGAVETPGCYLWTPGDYTLADLMERAGGAKETAGQTVRIVRGGRAGVVLRYPDQATFRLQAGDIVHLQPARTSAARVIQFEQYSPQAATTGATSVVRPVNHTEANSKRDRGHVVLLGVDQVPVVMPLWTDGLTVETLLTRYLKQPSEVAARTRLTAGKFPVGRPGELQDGMVLAVPAHLVDKPALPRLPAAIKPADLQQSGTSTTPAAPAKQSALNQPKTSLSAYGLPEINGGSELTIMPQPTKPPQPQPVDTPPQKQSAPAIPQETQATPPQTEMPRLVVDEPTGLQPSELKIPATNSSVPSLDGLTTAKSTDPSAADTNPGEESFEEQLPSFEEMLEETFAAAPEAAIAANETTASKENAATKADSWPAGDFEQLLADKQAAIAHLPGEGEVVPDPRARVEAEPALTPVGMIAGAIVIIGVLTVIVAAIRSHLFPGALLPEWVESQITRQEEQTRPRPTPPSRRSPVSPPVQKTTVTPVAAPAVEIEKAEPESAGLPIVEEPVQLPREVAFFGKPQLHYEFRIDGSHEIRKPHIAAAPRKPKPQSQSQPGVDDIIDRFRDEADTESTPAASEETGLTYKNAAEYPLDDIDTTDLFAAAYAIQAATQKRNS